METRRAFFAKLVGAIAAVKGLPVATAAAAAPLETPKMLERSAAPPIGGRWSQAPGPAIAPTPTATRENAYNEYREQWEQAGLDYERSRPRVLPNLFDSRDPWHAAPIDVPPELRAIVAMRDQCNREIANWHNVQPPRPYVVMCSCPDPLTCEHPYPQLLQPYYTKDRA